MDAYPLDVRLFAQQAIDLLDLQKRYFAQRRADDARAGQTLAECKATEARARERAAEVAGDKSQPEEVRQLARDLLSVLALQARYFSEVRRRVPSAGATLDTSKAAERALRVHALEIRGAVPGGLF